MSRSTRGGAQTERRPAAPTVADLLPAFLDRLAADGRAEHTIVSTRLDLQQLARFLGKQPVATVALEDLQAFFNWLTRQQGNGVASIRRKTSTVKRFFRQACVDGVIERDPAAGLIYPSAEPAESTPLSPAETEPIVAAATSPAWRALILCLVDAGLKRDEAVAVRWEDLELDPDDGGPPRLHVRHRRATKRVRHRTIGLTRRLANAFADLAAVEGKDPGSAEGAVFDLSARGVDFAVETCGRRAGVRPDEKVTPQMLRDAFACRRMAALMAREAAPDLGPEKVAALRREHDRLLARELGLSDAGSAADRYRRLVGRLQGDRAEQGRLDHE